MNKLKLSIELVPKSCWFFNVRVIVSAAQWDTIRFAVYTKAYNICEICSNVGPNHPVECHEIWHYDDKKLIQKLEGMISLCPNCHMVKHIGLAQIQGKQELAMNHFMKINGLGKDKAVKLINDSFALWQKRSKKQWILDISILKNYGIDVEKLVKK